MTASNSERVLARFLTGNGELILTSHRVVFGWRTRFTTIMLADVASVRMARLTQRWIGSVIGACLGIATCLMGATLIGVEPDIPHPLASALVLLSGSLLATFGVTRFNVVQISSPQATIRFRIPSVHRAQINRVLLEMDRARARWGAPKAAPLEPALQVVTAPRLGTATAPKTAPLEPAPQVVTAPASGAAGAAVRQPSPAQPDRRPMYLLRLIRGVREFFGGGESLTEWLREAFSLVGAYTPVAIVVVAIAWTGIRVLLSIWHSSFSK